MLAPARIGFEGLPAMPALEGAQGQPHGGTGGAQAGPLGTGLGDGLTHRDAPLLGEGAASDASQMARTFFWSTSKAAASARARSL